eukprot:1592360-Rhodomonas_salina.1
MHYRGLQVDVVNLAGVRLVLLSHVLWAPARDDLDLQRHQRDARLVQSFKRVFRDLERSDIQVQHQVAAALSLDRVGTNRSQRPRKRNAIDDMIAGNRGRFEPRSAQPAQIIRRNAQQLRNRFEASAELFDPQLHRIAPERERPLGQVRGLLLLFRPQVCVFHDHRVDVHDVDGGEVRRNDVQMPQQRQKLIRDHTMPPRDGILRSSSNLDRRCVLLRKHLEEILYVPASQPRIDDGQLVVGAVQQIVGHAFNSN